jgi:hypothetical protein
MSPDIRKDPLYDEPVNIDLEPEEAFATLLDASDGDEEEDTVETES